MLTPAAAAVPQHSGCFHVTCAVVTSPSVRRTPMCCWANFK